MAGQFGPVIWSQPRNELANESRLGRWQWRGEIEAILAKSTANTLKTGSVVGRRRRDCRTILPAQNVISKLTNEHARMGKRLMKRQTVYIYIHSYWSGDDDEQNKIQKKSQSQRPHHSLGYAHTVAVAALPLGYYLDYFITFDMREASVAAFMCVRERCPAGKRK